MSTIEASPRPPQPQPLPLPLVRLSRHPLKWTANHLELLIAAIVLAHIGTLIVVGLYYLVFEVYHPVTSAWHSAVSDSATRHELRNVYEGVLGGALAQFVVFNHFARRSTKLHRFDRLEIRLHLPNLKDGRQLSGWQLLVSPLLVLVYAIPGFLVGAGVVWLIRHGVTTTHQYKAFFTSHLGHSTWGRVQSLWTGNTDQKLVGFFASFFLGRRPVRAVADDVQGYFAARRVTLGKPQRFYHPPNFRARMNALSSEDASLRLGRTARLVPYLLSTALALGLALAAFGYWVLANKA